MIGKVCSESQDWRRPKQSGQPDATVHRSRVTVQKHPLGARRKWGDFSRKKIMKNITVIIFFLAITSGLAQSKLEVTVLNVKDTTGTIRVGIFKDENTFLKDAFIGKVIRAGKGEVNVVFENVPDGTYALSVIHDENKNGELDSNLIGIPREGFGFSNDAMGTFGPPSFEKSGFVLKKEARKMKVTMRYM